MTLTSCARILDPTDNSIREADVGIPIDRIIFWYRGEDGGTCLLLEGYGPLWVSMSMEEVDAMMCAHAAHSCYAEA